MIIKMLVVQGRPAGKSLQFSIGEYYFGRGAECHVRPNSEWVSRQHCLLRVTAAGVFLRDLGSRNGTLVNGELLHAERLLRHGDHIQLGPLVFELQIEADGVAPPGAKAFAGLEPPTTEEAERESTENFPAVTVPLHRLKE